jgi:hypothetical protein
MPKIEIARAGTGKARRRTKTAIAEQRMRRPDGQIVRVLSIDPHSPTFADDLTGAFQRNIAKARRENKKLFGSPDGPQAKK